MIKRLVVIGDWGKIDTTRAINLVRRALEIYPFGDDIDKIVYTLSKSITPTLVMCEGEGSIEELVPSAIVLASGIDRIINWCNIHSLEVNSDDKD